jgi:filamentous hemagglutinin family protein
MTLTRPRHATLHRLKALSLAVASLCPGGSLLAQTTAPALPAGASVVHGTASISVQGSRMTVSNSADAILNWQSFSVGAGHSVYFRQPDAASQVLNRVVGNNASQIAGSIASNGTVWLLNPYGVLFSPTARVDAAGLVASTLNAQDSDWKAHRYSLFADPATPAGAELRNQGVLQAGAGGRVVLVGNSGGGVSNAGTINAPGGEIALLAGERITLVDTGNPFLGVQVQVQVQVLGQGQGQTPGGPAGNSGSLLAAGGRITMNAAMVNQQGLVSADGLAMGPGGVVMLTASNTATLAAGSRTQADGGHGGRVVVQAPSTLVSGDISSAGQAGTGGQVQLLGDHVGLFGTAAVDASGTLGGGQVRVGGGRRGQDASLPNASAVYMGPLTRISADASRNGQGGDIVLWSNKATRAYGSLSARGGPDGGDGGFIETSGGWLDARPASVRAGALRGKAGEWLLDPFDIEIVSTGTTGASGSGVGTVIAGSSEIWTSNAQPATIDANSLFLSLSDFNVSVETGSSGTGLGDITMSNVVLDNRTQTPAHALTLNAAGSIRLTNASLLMAGNTTLTAGTSVVLQGASIITNVAAVISADTVSMDAASRVQAGTGIEIRGTTGNVKSLQLAGGATATSVGPQLSTTDVGGITVYVTDLPGSANTRLGDFTPTQTLSGTYPNDTLPVSGNLLVIAAPPLAPASPAPAPPPLPPSSAAPPAAAPVPPPVVKVLEPEQARTFSAIDLVSMPPALVAEQLAARDLHMERVLAGAMARLNESPRIASLPDCSTPQQAAQGNCLVTEAMLEPLRVYLDGEMQRLLRNSERFNLARVAGTPDCASLDEALRGGCLVTDKLKQELRASLAAGNDATRAGSARAPIPQIRRKWAIVIGINDYIPAIPRLVNAQLDAHNLKDILQRRFGYEVSLVLNGRKAEIIAAFNRVAAQAQADDSLLVYYAGHGAVARQSNEGYWVPSDAHADDPSSFISNSDILALLNRMAPRQLALISDSCFSGSLIASDADRFRGRSSVSDPLEVLDKRAAVVMTAGRNEPVADADKQGKSVFASILIKALEGVNGWFAGDRVFQEVARQIARSLEGQRALYAGLSKARHQPGTDYLFETRTLEAPK